MAEALTLDEHLGRCYGEVVLQRSDCIAACRDFAKALKHHAPLEAEARAKLASLEGIPDRRCFVSKIQRERLTAALATLNA